MIIEKRRKAKFVLINKVEAHKYAINYFLVIHRAGWCNENAWEVSD